MKSIFQRLIVAFLVLGIVNPAFAAEPLRTPVIVMNTATQAGAAGSQVEQLRELGWAWSRLMVAAGWTVTRSSEGNGAPGTSQAGAADYWATNYGTNLRIDTSGNGAWIVLSSPAGWVDTGTIYVRAHFADSNASATPGTFTINISAGAFTGGSVTALPTSASTLATPPIQGYLTPNVGAVPALRYTTYRTARGDTRFIVKRHGVNLFNAGIDLWANIDATGGGTGNRRAWVHSGSSETGDGYFASALWTSSNYFAALSPDGSLSVLTIAETMSSRLSALWTGGVGPDGTPMVASVEVGQNVAAGRYLGRWIDTWGAPTLLSWGAMIATESSQTHRKVCVGDFFIYFTTADLPIQ